MVFRQLVRLLLAALFVSTAMPAFSQVVAAATQRSWPLEVGGGLSDFSTHVVNHQYPNDPDAIKFKGSLLGPAAWIDFTLPHLPHRLYGLGIEAEGRHLAYANSGADPLLKEDTGEGGIIYKWRRYRSFHPYGKYLMGFGSIDFDGGYLGCTHNCQHDTDTFSAVGGGADVHLRGNLWARGDYEEEFWTNFGSPSNKTVYPKGFTIGVSYDMRNFHIGRQSQTSY